MANDTFDRDLEVPDSLNMDAITGIEQRLAELSAALKELKGQKNAIPDALNIKDSVMYANKLAELTKSVYEYKNALKDRGDFAEKDYIKETMAYVNNLTLAYKKLSDELISLETDDSKLLDSNEAVEKSVIALTEALSAIIPVKKKKAEITNEVVTATKEETKATEELNKAQSGTINITDVVAKGKKGKAKNSEEVVKATNAETAAIEKQNEALKESEKLKGSSKPAKSQAFMVDIVNDDKSKTPLDKMISAYKSQVSFTGGGLIRDYDKVKGSEEAIINFYKEQASIINRIQEVTTKAAIYVGGGIGSGKSYMLRNLAGAENFYTISKGKDSSVIAADLFGFNREGTGSSMTGVKGVKGSPGILEKAAAKGGTVVIDEFFNMDAKTMTEMLDFLASGKFRSGSTGKEVDFYANGAKLITSSRYTPEEALRLGKLSPDMYSRVKDNIRFTMPDVAKDGKMSNELFHGFFNYFLNQTAQGSSNEVLQKLKGLSIDETFTKAMLPNIKSVRDVESLAKNIIGTMQADPLSFIDGDKTRLSSKTFDVKSFAEKAQLTPEFDSYEQEMIAGLKNIEAKLGSVTNAESTLKVASEGSSKALQQQDAITKAKVDSIAKLVNSLKNLSSSEEGVTKSVNTSVESMEKKKKKIQEVTNITPPATAPPVVDQILNDAIKQQKPVLTGYPKRTYDVESDRTKISSLDAIIAEKTKKTNDIQESLNTMPSLIRADVKSSTDALQLAAAEKDKAIENEFLKKVAKVKSVIGIDNFLVDEDIKKFRLAANKKHEKNQADLQKLITIEEINIGNKYSEVISFMQDSYNKEMADLEIIKKQRAGYQKRVDIYDNRVNTAVDEYLNNEKANKTIPNEYVITNKRYTESDLLSAAEAEQMKRDSLNKQINQARFDTLNQQINQAKQAEFKKEADLFDAENRRQEKISKLEAIIEEKNRLYDEAIKKEQASKYTKELNSVLDRSNVNLDSIFNIVGRSTSDDKQLKNSAFSAFYKTGHGTDGVPPTGGIKGDDASANMLFNNLERQMLSFRQSFGMKMWKDGMQKEFEDFDTMILAFNKLDKGDKGLHSEKFKTFLLEYKKVFDANITKFTETYGEAATKRMQSEMNAMISNLEYQKGTGDESKLFSKGSFNTIYTGVSAFDKRRKDSNKIKTFGSSEEEWLRQIFGLSPDTLGSSFKKPESTFFKEIKNNQVQSVLGNINNFYYRMKQLKEELPEFMQLMNTTVTKIAFSFSRLAFGVQVVVMNMALLKTAFIGTFGYALNKSIEFTKSLVEQTEKMQKARITLTGIFGKERAQDMIKFAKEYAVSSPATFEEITNMVRSFGLTPQIRNMLKRATGEQAKAQMKDLADITVALGMTKPEQGTQGAMFSLREALAGQWRSLKMRFEIVPDAVAASIGKTVKEIEKSPELLTRAFKEFWRLSLGKDTLTELSETVKVQINNIYDFVEQLGQKIGEAGFYKHLQNNVTNIAEAFKGLLDTEWIDTKASNFSNTLIKYSDTLLNTFRDFAAQVLQIKSIDPDISANAQKRLNKGEIKPEAVADYMKNAQLIRSIIDTVDDAYLKITEYTKEISVFAGSIAKLFTSNKDTIDSFIHDAGRMGKEIVNMFIIAGGYYAKIFSWIANIGGGSDKLYYTLLKITAAISMVFPIASANIFINAGRILIEVLTTLTRRDLFVQLASILNKSTVAMGSFVNVIKSMTGLNALNGTFTQITPLKKSGILSNALGGAETLENVVKMSTFNRFFSALRLGVTGAIVSGMLLAFTGAEAGDGIRRMMDTAIGIITSHPFIAAGGFLALMFPDAAMLAAEKSIKYLWDLYKTHGTKAAVFTQLAQNALWAGIAVAITTALVSAIDPLLKLMDRLNLLWERSATLTIKTDTIDGLFKGTGMAPGTQMEMRQQWIKDILAYNEGMYKTPLYKAGFIDTKGNLNTESPVYSDAMAFKSAADSLKILVDSFNKPINTTIIGSAKTGIVDTTIDSVMTAYDEIQRKIDEYEKAGKNARGGNAGPSSDNPYVAQKEALKDIYGYEINLNNLADEIVSKDNAQLVAQKASLEIQQKMNPLLFNALGLTEKMAAANSKLSDYKEQSLSNPLLRDVSSAGQAARVEMNQFSQYFQKTKKGKLEELKLAKDELERIYSLNMARYEELKNNISTASYSLGNAFQFFLNSVIDKLIDFLTKIKSLLSSLSFGGINIGGFLAAPITSAIDKLGSYKKDAFKPMTKTENEVANKDLEGKIKDLKKQREEASYGIAEQMKGLAGGGADKQAQLAKDYANDMKKLNKEYLEATNQTTLARIQGAKDEYDAAIKSYEEKYKGFKNYEELMTKAKAVEEAKRAKATREAFIDIYAKIEKNQYMPSSLRMKAYEETQRYELEKELTNIYSVMKNIPEFKEVGAKLAEALQEGYKESLRDNAWKLHDEVYKNLIGNQSAKIESILKDNYFMNSLSIGQKQQAYGYQASFTELNSKHKLQEMALDYQKAIRSIDRLEPAELQNLGTTKERLKELEAITFEMQRQAEILKTQKEIQELQLRQHNDFKGAFKLGFEETVKGFESGFDVMKRGGEELANGLRNGLSEALTKTILKESDDIREIWSALWKDLVRIMVKTLMDTVVNNLMQSFMGFGKEGKNNPFTLNRGADDAGMSLSNVATQANSLAPTFTYLEQATRAAADAMASIAGTDKFLGGERGSDIFAEYDDGEGEEGGGFNLGSLLGLARNFLPGFADGGIVSAPTMAIIGEGKTNEAVVPMPNGKAIPVDLKGKQESASTGVTIINVLDPSLLDAYVAQNPDAIINLVALDTMKGGKTFQASKAKQSK